MPYFLLRYQFLRKSTFVTGRDGYKVLFLFLEQYRLMRRVFLEIYFKNRKSGRGECCAASVFARIACRHFFPRGNG